MKVVLLTTARGQRPATLATLRSQLGLLPDDGSELVVVSWHAPKRPLPVRSNLLVGPHLRISGAARVLPVGDPFAGIDDDDLDAPAEVPSEITDSDTGLDDLPDDLPEDVPDIEPEPAPARPAPLDPIYHPQRITKAVSWRVNRTRLAIRRNPTVNRVRNSTKLRKLRNKLAPGSLGSRYAVACLRAPNVHDEVATADVVVALDANTHRAAWLLARRHPAPAVVVGTAAGKRVLTERAAQAATS